MHRLARGSAAIFLGLLLWTIPVASQQPPGGRALTIEDYYRVKSVGNPSISPNGNWVAFTVTTRVEDDKESNKSDVEGFVVPFDGGGKPAKIDASGSVTNLRWLDDSWLQYTV